MENLRVKCIPFNIMLMRNRGLKWEICLSTKYKQHLYDDDDGGGGGIHNFVVLMYV